jgi:hypothetical protein
VEGADTKLDEQLRAPLHFQSSLDSFKMEVLSSVTNYISEFRYEQGVTPLTAYYAPLTIGATYLVGVYLLQMFMKNRERIPAKTFSLIHNFNMYAISIICFVGISYGVGQTLYVRPQKEGFLFGSTKKKRTKKHGSGGHMAPSYSLQPLLFTLSSRYAYGPFIPHLVPFISTLS